VQREQWCRLIFCGCIFGVKSSRLLLFVQTLLANLTAGEILEQLYHANKIEKIRNVVFMGMGEPVRIVDVF
jgi:hypothetical protein